MRTLRTQRDRRAFWLVEMMIIVGLVGAFGMIAMVVVRLSTRASFTATQTLEAEHRFDQAIRMLRADVQASSTIKADNSTADLQTAAGQIHWQIRPDGWLIRRQGRDESSWERMPAGLRFEAGPARLTVISPSAEQSEDRLMLRSAVASPEKVRGAQ